MLPFTHKIISEHVHYNVKETLGIELNKNSLIYGSIKPDIAPKLLMLDHFKPQTFNLIINEALELSKNQLFNNQWHIKRFSEEIGVITHFIADFFCVPHNDRKTYKNNFINHVIYEKNLHMKFKEFDNKLEIMKPHFNIENSSVNLLQNLFDSLHNSYQRRGESLENDLKSSIYASSAMAMFIVYHSINNGYNRKIA